MEAISDCLRLEMQPPGIDVVIIEPGGIRTEWAAIAAGKLRATSSMGAYADAGEMPWAPSMGGEAFAKRLSPPELIADTIAKALSARRPKTRYAVGSGAKPLLFLRRLLSDRAFDGLIRVALARSR